MQLFRRKRSLKDRAIKRGRELRKAAPQLDLPWARTRAAGTIRENFLRFALRPAMNFYTRRRSTGKDTLSRIKGPVILVANHASHIDTPVILAALPRRLRKRTAVAAAADYFYRNRWMAAMVSLVFNTVPMDRDGGGLGKQATEHLDRLLDQGWNLLLYPEGTRSRGGGPGRIKRGAAVLARRHKLPVVPIRVSGTSEVMPPGRFWPKRLHGRIMSKRHKVQICFGEPIRPLEDPTAVIERVQRFFEQGDGDGDGAAARVREKLAAGRY